MRENINFAHKNCVDSQQPVQRFNDQTVLGLDVLSCFTHSLDMANRKCSPSHQRDTVQDSESHTVPLVALISAPGLWLMPASMKLCQTCWTIKRISKESQFCTKISLQIKAKPNPNQTKNSAGQKNG